MHIFPWVTEEYHSPLAPAEVLRRVQADTAPPLTWRDLWQGQSAAAFRGRVWGEGFEISRVISYRNSMLPQITGWVAPDCGKGSHVRLRHRLHPLVLVFAAVWLTFVGTGVLGFGSGLLATRQLNSAALIPSAMLVFGLLFFTVPFWLEVRKSRPRLIELLQLEPAQPA